MSGLVQHSVLGCIPGEDCLLPMLPSGRIVLTQHGLWIQTTVVKTDVLSGVWQENCPVWTFLFNLFSKQHTRFSGAPANFGFTEPSALPPVWREHSTQNTDFSPFPFSGREDDFHLSISGRCPQELYIRKHIFTRHFKAPVLTVTGVLSASHFLKWLYQLNFYQEDRSCEHFSFSKYAVCWLVLLLLCLLWLTLSPSVPQPPQTCLSLLPPTPSSIFLSLTSQSQSLPFFFLFYLSLWLYCVNFFFF